MTVTPFPSTATLTPFPSTATATRFPPTATVTPFPLTPTSVPPTATSLPPPSPTVLPTQSATPTPAPTVMVETESPKRMETDRSDSIRVSLVRIAGQTYAPTIEIIGHTAVVASPIPVGTPNFPIQSAFGSEYEAFATAYLAATAFDVKSVTSEEQPLEQPRINWEWNVIPKNDGPQTVNLSIEVRWKPKGGGQIIQRQIWRTRLDILVERPLITTGQLSILTLIGGFVGSGLSIPWIFERVKAIAGEQKTRKRKKDGTTRKK